MISATITTKGQVTIPKAVRDSLTLQPGDKIEFILTDQHEALIRPISKKVDDLFGILQQPGRKPVAVAEMDAAVRRKMKERL
ncbi:MAG: AbrB/MazE/SpoVT family DNA-binding domain-containing protein [Desulfobacteraceae bacterium]|nr:AbrB/MazE/SpoVT family DNA-binding domain-containing protein [Desulfobacteraceae bacterium]